MWYFAWVLGIGFAVLLAILNALWGENEEAREQARADALRQAHAGVDPARANGKAAH
ncbi:MAG TPA: cytochrome bd-I oxidase subunit CydX [Rhodocyclaceae bacterium]|nr:cytochrome bd-I oxidase subunit CydX [Rhodocyclaceae bacterium]